MGNAPYIVVAILAGLGLAIMLTNKNLIKIIIGIAVVESAVNLFIVLTGYRSEAIAPIFTHAPEAQSVVLPTPQALTLTAIVIGLATTGLLLSFAMIIYRKYGTLDIDSIKKLK